MKNKRMNQKKQSLSIFENKCSENFKKQCKTFGKILPLTGVFQEFLNSYLPEYALVATIKLEYGKYDPSIKDFP